MSVHILPCMYEHGDSTKLNTDHSFLFDQGDTLIEPTTVLLKQNCDRLTTFEIVKHTVHSVLMYYKYPQAIITRLQAIFPVLKHYFTGWHTIK